MNGAEQEIEKIKAEAEQREAYKTKYGAVEKIESEDGQHVLWLKKPSRLAVGYFMSEYGNNRVIACEYVLNDAVIKEISDYDYFIQDENFYGIMNHLVNLISLKKSTSTTL